MTNDVENDSVGLKLQRQPLSSIYLNFRECLIGSKLIFFPFILSYVTGTIEKKRKDLKSDDGGRGMMKLAVGGEWDDKITSSINLSAGIWMLEIMLDVSTVKRIGTRVRMLIHYSFKFVSFFFVCVC